MEMQNDYMNLRVGAGKFFYGHGCIRELAIEIKKTAGRQAPVDWQPRLCQARTGVEQRRL